MTWMQVPLPSSLKLPLIGLTSRPVITLVNWSNNPGQARIASNLVDLLNSTQPPCDQVRRRRDPPDFVESVLH